MSRMKRDPIPDWAGGRDGAHRKTGPDRLRQIVADAAATGATEDDTAWLTVRQARELLAKGGDHA